MLVPEAAKLKKKRWAIVYPNYEYGQSAAAVVQEAAEGSAAGRRVRRRAGAAARQDRRRRVVQALADAKPDAIFSVAVRRRPAEVRARGQHARPVQGPRGVQPAGRRARVPRPAEGRDAGRLDGSPAIRGTASRRPSTSVPRRLPGKYKDYPRLGSVVGYSDDQVDRRRRSQGGLAPTPRSWSRRFKGLEVRDAVRQDRPTAPHGSPVDDGRLRRPDRARRTARASWWTGATPTARSSSRPTTK